jgi:hypothetical protein
MAVCAGGLRTYLERHGGLPSDPLVAMVPVSIRTGRETEKWTNRVSAITSPLPTNEADPVQRVAIVHESMRSAKELFDAVPADQLTDFSQFAPPAVFAQAMRTSTRLSARFGRSPVNLIISNVPGPRHPLYTAGAQLLHYYPVSTIVDGQGLNITVQSYLNTLDFGLVSCRELVPDLWDLLDDIIQDLVQLGAAVGVEVQASEPAPAVERARATRARRTSSSRSTSATAATRAESSSAADATSSRSRSRASTRSATPRKAAASRKSSGSNGRSSAAASRKATAKRITKAAARAAS